jgi:hypothetical protein
MRGDMSEVIIERPRVGSHRRFVRRHRRIDDKTTTRLDPDKLIAQIGLKRAAAENARRKYLNENLKPLLRYLERQVNRPWNKVWSEICANLKTTSTVQQHVRDHIKDFVAIDAVSKDGKLWVKRWGRLVPLSDTWFSLYVDPRTGILRPNKQRKTRRQVRRAMEVAEATERAARMRAIGPDVQLHLLDDGAWWEVRLDSLRARYDGYAARWTDKPYREDVVYRANLTRLRPSELYGWSDVYAIAKRQLSHKEIVKLGLRAKV